MPLGASRLNSLARFVAAAEEGRDAVTVTANGDAQIDTAQSKFGGASALFDGAGDYLSMDKTVGDFGSNTFTVEAWVRVPSADGAFENIASIWHGSTANNRSWFLGIDDNTQHIVFFWYDSGGAIDTSVESTGVLTSGNWHHVAVTNDGSNFRLFLDGTLEDSGAAETIRAAVAGSSLTIGGNYDASLPVNGNIDEVRISNTARYTSNFTPSTSAFTNDANTTLLLHMNGTDGSTTFVDDNGGTGEVSWDLNYASYASKSFNVSSQDSSPKGLFIKPDGTKLYMIGTTGDNVYQYSLSTAWDISTASYDSKSASSSNSTPHSVFFKPDGTVMYTVGSNNDRMYQYNLSTAWDVSTATVDDNFLLSSQDAAPVKMFFRDNGTDMYMLGVGTDSIYQYSLSTAWDIGTLSYASKSFSVTSQESLPFGMHFKDDGSKLFVAGYGSDAVYEYNLSTPWDISTASYTSKSLKINTQSGDAQDMFWKSDGTAFYIMDAVDDTIYQYSISQ